MKLFLGGAEVTVFMTSYLLASLVMPVYVMEILGVEQGDWALYKVVSAWNSTIANDTVPQYMVDFNQTTWKVQVEEILGTEEIRILLTRELKNGTKLETLEGNVRTGLGNLGLWVIRRNLNVGDVLIEGEGVKVNKTELRPFAGATRSTVYAWFNEEEADGSISGYAFFWDRETGFLCGQVVSSVHIVEEEGVSQTIIRLNMVETSLWAPSVDNVWFLVVAVIIVVLVLAIVFFVQKRRKLRRRKTRKRSS